MTSPASLNLPTFYHASSSEHLAFLTPGSRHAVNAKIERSPAFNLPLSVLQVWEQDSILCIWHRYSSVVGLYSVRGLGVLLCRPYCGLYQGQASTASQSLSEKQGTETAVSHIHIGIGRHGLENTLARERLARNGRRGFNGEGLQGEALGQPGKSVHG